MEFDEIPVKIKGDYTGDFFELNKDLKKFPVIKQLLEEKNQEEASKIMWSIYFLIDPRSFFYDKMSYNTRVMFIRKNYYKDFNDERDVKPLIEFYEEEIIKNEEIIMFLQMKKQLQKGIESPMAKTFTIQKAIESKDALINDSKRCFSLLNEFEGKKNYYPRTIEGDFETDDFFESNKEVCLYPEVSKLIEKEGNKIASKIMWSFFYVRDPKSFYFDKMNIKELEDRCNKSFFKLKFDDYVHIEKLYTDHILMNEDKVDYSILSLRQKILIEQSGGADVQKLKEGREQLLALKNRLIKNESKYTTLVFQGKEQPGLLAATKLN
jgi:hypothetical protein